MLRMLLEIKLSKAAAALYACMCLVAALYVCMCLVVSLHACALLLHFMFARALLLHWQMYVSHAAVMCRKEWATGWSVMQVSSWR